MVEQVDDALGGVLFQNLSEYGRDVEQSVVVAVNGQRRRRCRCRGKEVGKMAKKRNRPSSRMGIPENFDLRQTLPAYGTVAHVVILVIPCFWHKDISIASLSAFHPGYK